uniref:NmrA-like domain-containing protein n=1 Tax=Fusarium oxysporum (strain Fo5176) TaxID=660025 RepID=A0A0C4DJJ7_FUSOF
MTAVSEKVNNYSDASKRPVALKLRSSGLRNKRPQSSASSRPNSTLTMTWGMTFSPSQTSGSTTSQERELEKSSLEFTYIYPGMFMDYFGMPHVSTHLRELYIVIDPTNGVAYVPGDGEAKLAMSYAKDVVKYTALALDLEKWPRVMTTASCAMTLNQIVALTEKNLGRKLKVTYQQIPALLKHDSKTLPGNIVVTDKYPGGLEKIMALTADLECSIGLGAYDFDKLSEHLNLVDHFVGKTEPPKKIEDVLEMAWKGR